MERCHQQRDEEHPASTQSVQGDIKDLLPGYQCIRCHMVFDIKFAEYFKRKAHFVAGDHTTKTPSMLTYSFVVSQDLVCIALLLVALNDIKLQLLNIQNVYLTADCWERIWTRAGPEFGLEQGSIMIVCKVLYGLKISGAAFQSLLVDTL